MPRVSSPTKKSPPERPPAVELFLRLLERETKDPVHLRLIKAARATDPATSLERELERIVEELLV